MTFRISPLQAPLGAVVEDLDLDGLSPDDRASLYEAFLDFGMLVFKGVDLGIERQLKLARLFGEPWGGHPLPELRHPTVPELTVLTANGGVAVAADDPEADRIVGTIPWHGDKMYTERPNRGSLLRAVVIPAEGGYTGWMDTSQLYRTLSVEMKAKLQGLRIVHSYATSHKKQSMVGGAPDALPDAIFPLVFVHPETDVPLLNISPATAREIVGLPGDEGAELLDFLIDHATREENAYVHRWEPEDVVAWDNWRCLHRAYGHPKRYPRVMHSMALRSPMAHGREIAPDISPLELAVA